MTSATDSSRRNRPHPLDELERALNRLRHQTTSGRATTRGILKSLVIQSFCVTPIQAALNDFWGLSRHLSRLDKPQKLFHHNEGSG